MLLEEVRKWLKVGGMLILLGIIFHGWWEISRSLRFKIKEVVKSV